MNREIIIDKNMRELNPQGDFRFPINLMYIILSQYPFFSFPGHWHSEIEATYILDGEMTYMVNQSALHLKKGDCIFVNTNTLHAGEQYQDSDCVYVCFMFNPALIYGFENSLIKSQYVSPILEASHYAYALFHGESKEHLHIAELIEKLIQYSGLHNPGYELHIASILTELWFYYYEDYLQFISKNEAVLNPIKTRHLERLKNSLSFIYTNYAEPITLDEIAGSCHISKSEFCRLFKQTLHQTPFDFLLRYRIEQSLPMLCEGNLSITEIACAVGFSGPSYYAEVFRKYMHCSPTKYKKQHSSNA